MEAEATSYIDKTRLVELIISHRESYNEICLLMNGIARIAAARFIWPCEADRDDSIQIAVLHCIKNLHKFDPNRNSSALAYFSQVAKNAMLRHSDARTRQLAILPLPENNDINEEGCER